MPFRIAIATHQGKPEASPDDLPLAALLQAADIEVEAVPWSSAETDWAAYDAVLIRSTWDYHQHLEAFRAWTRAVEAAGARLWNPAVVVAWNSEKTYLRELERAGIPIVPTAWVTRGAPIPLAAVLAEAGWPAVVVKPTISASAFRTWRQKDDEAAAHQDDFASLLEHSGAMIQPLLPEVIEDGEWSFLFFRKEGKLAFSHAVLKKPAAGDFRVQSELGGQAAAKSPPAELLSQVEELVRKAAAIAPGELLYARIDGVASRGGSAPAGTFLLMELELIEPFLFLEGSPGAAASFAAAVREVLG